MNNEIIEKVLKLCENDIDSQTPDDITEAKVPRFQLPSGFNYFSLFSIANNYLPNSTVYQISNTNQNRNNSYNLITENSDPTFDYSSTFKYSCEKLDPRYFDEFSLRENERSIYDDAFYSKLTKLSDRNPNLFLNIRETHQKSMCSTQFQWIDLDQIDSQSFSQKDLIKYELSTNSTPDQPIVFFGDKIRDFPINVGLVPGQPFIYDSLSVEKLIEIRNSYDTQLTLSFAIGSDEEGVPVLFLFSYDSIVKVYDNQTVSIEDTDDIRKCNIKMLCYTIPGNQWSENREEDEDENNSVFKFTCTSQTLSKNSSIHPRITSTTADSFLLNFIHWEKKNKWINEKFTLKEYLIECIEHPSIFLSDFDDTDDREPSSYKAAVCLNSDDNCKKFIFQDEDEDKSVKNSFYTFTGFTVFTRAFVKWLKSIKENNESDFESYLKNVFYHLPVSNKYISYAVIKLVCDVCVDRPETEAYQIFSKILKDVNELQNVSQSFLEKLPKIINNARSHKSINVLVQKYRSDTPVISPRKIVSLLENAYDTEAIPQLENLPKYDSDQEFESFEFDNSYIQIQETALNSNEIRY